MAMPGLERHADTAAIAEALDVSADSLVGEPAPEIQPHAEVCSFRPLRSALLDVTLDEPRDCRLGRLPCPVIWPTPRTPHCGGRITAHSRRSSPACSMNSRFTRPPHAGRTGTWR